MHVCMLGLGAKETKSSRWIWIYLASCASMDWSRLDLLYFVSLGFYGLESPGLTLLCFPRLYGLESHGLTLLCFPRLYGLESPGLTSFVSLCSMDWSRLDLHSFVVVKMTPWSSILAMGDLVPKSERWRGGEKKTKDFAKWPFGSM